MADCMNFPRNPMEFVKSYSFKDSEEVYTNGSNLIPVFRVEQMLEHYYPKKQTNADRIRAMTDEELAEFLKQRNPCNYYCNYVGKSCHLVSCKQGVLEWLQSEAE